MVSESSHSTCPGCTVDAEALRYRIHHLLVKPGLDTPFLECRADFGDAFMVVTTHHNGFCQRKLTDRYHGTISARAHTFRRFPTLRPMRALRRARSGRLIVRHCSSDAFSSGWTLPFRQEPWGLPFAVTQQEALAAFMTHHDRESGPKITLRAVRPCHVPFYVFEGTLAASFTGTIGYDDGAESDAHGLVQAREFTRSDIGCESVDIGADTGAVSAVYAGFKFRRLFLRQALSDGLSEGLLQSAVPLRQLVGQPAGAVADDFEMKPSFAYRERIHQRLPEVAHHHAECRMRHDVTRALDFWCGEERVRPCDREPDYDFVSDVAYELEAPRLHDRGVIALPVWVVEYACLGQSFRAFISATDRSGRRADCAVRVAGMQHGSPWSDEAAPSAARLTGDAGTMWAVIGQMRRLEAEANTDWRVDRFWLDEIARVMPDGQKGGSGEHVGFGGFRRGVSVTDADYELLELPSSPAPSSKAVRDAFRRQCMKWHPDLNAAAEPAERAACHERFTRIVRAYKGLRDKHPEWLDS